MKFIEYVAKKRYCYAIQVTKDWFTEGFELPNGVKLQKTLFTKKKYLTYSIYDNVLIGDYFVKGKGFYSKDFFERNHEVNKE